MKNILDGGEAIVEAFRNLGIRYVFCSPGSEWSPVWEALTRQDHENIPGPTYMQVWHETLAVNMATGYTFQTGEPQAVLLHAGVGPLQGVMGIHAAMQSEIPMLVMAGESVTLGADPDLNMEAQWFGGVSPGGSDRLVSNSVKYASMVPSAPTLYRSIVRSGEMAIRAPRGPVFLDVPLEFMLENWTPDRELERVPPASATQAVPSEIEKLVADIKAAENPMIVAEFSGREPGGFEALIAFAEAGAIPVIGGRAAFYGNFPTDHDLWLGLDSYQHLAEADLVLLVAARSPWYPPSKCPTEGRIVSIGDHPHKEWLVYQDLHADAYVEGDLGATLSAAAAMLEEAGPDADVRQARREKWAGVHADMAAKLQADRAAAVQVSNLNPISVAQAVRDVMPGDTIFIDETITHFLKMRDHLPVNHPRSLFKHTVSGLGQGFGLALGMKLGAPDRPVVLFVGDGSFLYNPITQALGAARDYGLGVIVVIMNNGGYKAMRNGHEMFYGDGMMTQTDLTYGYAINGPVFEELGAPFGIKGIRAETFDALKQALEAAHADTKEGRSVIINAIVPD